MDDDILNYYERELTFNREMGAEFAKKYPKIAGRLLLESDRCEDPHTERLIEAFAFISGRIHKKIDDDFPELTETLLNVLYPHYISPVPSLSIVRFDPVEETIPPSGFQIEKNTVLYSKPVGGTPCKFVTTYPVTLCPFEVVSARVQDPKKPIRNAQQSIAVQLKAFHGASFSTFSLDRIHFYLNGPAQHVFPLYELLLNNVCHVEFESANREGKIETAPLPPDAIEPVGLEPEEWMIPYTKRSFPGYILLFEYFCFPEKFLFFDLKGLDPVRRRSFNDTATITFYLDKPARPDLVISKETFCLTATPVVNLFRRIAEPIRVDHRKSQYRVIPDLRRPEATEVFSVDSVIASAGDSSEKGRDFKPFYSLRHYLDHEDQRTGGAFWHTKRVPSSREGDHGTEVFLSFADRDFKPAAPEVETLTVHVTCTNRDLPARLPFGDPSGDFDLETAAPVARINSLIKPSVSRRVSLGGALQWRLISHLSLNYMSLVEGGEEALKEILKLYDFENSSATRQQIEGIVSLKSSHVTKRIGQSMCRGIQSVITFDEDKYVGSGLYLFASVLERFLGQYVSVNSFSQLIARTIQRKEILKRWSPRNGSRVLL